MPAADNAARFLARSGQTSENIEFVLGRTLRFAEPPPTAEQYIAAYDGLARGTDVTRDRQVRLADGRLRWARFSARVERREGDTLHAIVLVTDVEDEKAAIAAAVAEAARREGKMRRIMDGLPAAGYGSRLHPDGRATQIYGNETIRRLLRAPPDLELSVDNSLPAYAATSAVRSGVELASKCFVQGKRRWRGMRCSFKKGLSEAGF
ncbi:MAG: hypothetical protein ACJ8AI_30040, partial [Rhodopila sp.]